MSSAPICAADPAHQRVLYIDDDEALARLTQKSLSRRGFSVDVAHSGPDGLRLVTSGDYDIVALDNYMPGQDGMDVLAAIQAIPSPPPVVFVTGADDGRVAVAALKAGAVDYVVKDTGDAYFDLLCRTLQQAIEAAETERARRAAEDALRVAHDRAQLMLREVNHRVANSLALVSSLVALQSRTLTDDGARQALEETQSRIAAIAQVHQRLYTSPDVATVDLDAYLRGLTEELQNSMRAAGRGASIRLDLEPVRIPTDKAVPIGVIVTELVTNAFKYAYAPGDDGEVRVSLRNRAAQGLRLEVADDGVGMGGEIRGTGLGSRIVKAMASTLKAPVIIDPAHRGTRVILDVSV